MVGNKKSKITRSRRTAMPCMFAACRTDEGDTACPEVLATKDELPAEAFTGYCAR
jgi:hypothetical protein